MDGIEKPIFGVAKADGVWHACLGMDGANPEHSQYRYWAFISYSHRDAEIAKWLHRALERYSVPKALQGQDSRNGPVPKRLFPIFRDRDEIPTSSDLGSTIQDALAQSRYLIVICSPQAAGSRWVEEEVRGFKALHGEDRILGLIASGTPNASDRPETAAEECFPLSLRQRVGPDGTTHRTEPIAADIRSGHDSRRIALLRVVAGLVGVYYDTLYQRDRRRRQRNLLTVAVTTVAVVGVIVSLAMIAGRKNALARESARKAAESAKEAKESARLEHLQEYVDDMQNMPELWRNDRVELLRARLASYVTNPAGEDIRGFEWYYWDRMAHSAVATFDSGSRVMSMDWSADGQTLWFVNVAGSVGSWNILSGAHAEIRPQKSGASGIAATPQGNRFAVFSINRRSSNSYLKLVDEKGASQAKVKANLMPFSSVAFSADGSKVVTGTMAGHVQVWNAGNLDLIVDLTDNPRSQRSPLNPRARLDVPDGSVTDVTFSPDGQTVAAVDEEGGVHLWNAGNGLCLKSVNGAGHGGPLSSIAFSHDGTKFVTRGVPNSAKMGGRPTPGELLIWDSQGSLTSYGSEFTQEAAIPAPNNMPGLPSALRAEFALEDTVIVSSMANVLRMDPPSGIGVAGMRKGNSAPITGLRVAANDDLVATADLNGQLAVWNLRTEPCGNWGQALRGPARGVALVGGGHRIAVLLDALTMPSSNDVQQPADWKRIVLFEGTMEIPVEKATGSYLDLVSSPSGKYFAAVGSLMGEAFVWDAATGKIVCMVKLPKSEQTHKKDDPASNFAARAAAFRGEDELFVIGESGCYVVGIAAKTVQPAPGWQTGAPARRLDHQVLLADDTVMCLAFNPTGQFAALGRAGGDITIMRRDTGQEVRTLRGHRRGVTALCFSQDGRRLISSSGRYAADGAIQSRDDAGEVKIWNLDSWREALTLVAPTDQEFSGVALGEGDRKLIATCNAVNFGPGRISSGNLFSWDTRAGSVEALLKPPAAKRPADSLTGKVLSFASTAIGANRAGFHSIAIHPSGDFLAGVNMAGTVVAWNCRTGELLRTNTLRSSPYWFLKFVGDGSVLYATSVSFPQPVFLKFPELTPTNGPTDQKLPEARDFLGEDPNHTFPDKVHYATIDQNDIRIGNVKSLPPPPPPAPAPITPTPAPATATPAPAPATPGLPAARGTAQ